MSKIVVFGAGGFIGQRLINQLADLKIHEILAFDKFSGYQKGTTHPFDKYDNVRIIPGDFFNRDDVSHVLSGADYVFHFISSTTPATSNNDPFIDIDTNIRSSVQLFELCASHGVKRVIFPSSGGTVYGNVDNERISETILPQPISPYGIGKLTIEHYLRYFKFTAGLDYIVYRIANPYGPGQNIYGKQGVIPIFMHHLLNGETVTIYGTGDMVRDYLYIDDLIKMIADSYEKDHTYSEYNLGSGQGATVNDLVKCIEKCSGQQLKISKTEAPPTFVQKSVLDITRYIDEFGKPSFTTLEEGIDKTWSYVKELR